MKIRLLTDSSSDLPLGWVKENADILSVAGMPIAIGSEEMIDDLGETFSHDYFYKKMAEGVMPKTSQINTKTFQDLFTKNHKEGYATLYIGLSSGLSGTINNANLAKNMLLERYEDAEVTIVDSLAASIGLGVLVMYALDLIRQGESLKTVTDKVEAHKLRANHWFAVDNLMHLKNGGRIPAAAAYVGTVLSVKPILTMEYDGKLSSYSTVRGKKKAYKYLAAKAAEHRPAADEIIMVGHANIESDAHILEEALRSQGIENEVVVTCLSCTIATHVGPGMMAVAFMGQEDREKK